MSSALKPIKPLVRFLLSLLFDIYLFFFSSRRRHTRCLSDWSSDVCSSDLMIRRPRPRRRVRRAVHLFPSPAHAHPLLPNPRPERVADAGRAAVELGVVLERRPQRRTG